MTYKTSMSAGDCLDECCSERRASRGNSVTGSVNRGCRVCWVVRTAVVGSLGWRECAVHLERRVEIVKSEHQGGLVTGIGRWIDRESTGCWVCRPDEWVERAWKVVT